jgi:hypothetical protein
MRLKWELVSVRLEIVLISMQDRYTVCAEHTIGSEIILIALDGTPSDMGLVKSRFGPFGDSVGVGARQVHGLRQMYHRFRNHFGHTQWYS